jgi:hypothetical protein
LVEGRPLAAIDAHDQTLIAASGGSCDLVYSPSFALIGPAAARAGIPTLHGVDPFQLQSSATLIAQAAGAPLTAYSIVAPPLPPGEDNPATALRAATPDYDLLGDLGVAWIASAFPLDGDRVHLQARWEEMYLYAVRDQDDTLAECMVSPNRRFITPTAGSGPVIVVQAWAPGWQAWADGRPTPVRRTDEGLIAIEAPPGTRVIAMAYRPVADFVGMGITGATVLGLVIVAAIHKRGAKVNA